MICDTYSGAKVGWLMGDKMIFMKVSNQAWDTMRPGQVAEFLTRETVSPNPRFIIKQRVATGPPEVTKKLKRDTLPKTILFMTRDGGRGIMQVTGLTDGPMGSVSIRYKLIK